MTNLAINRCGEHVTDIVDHGAAYLIGERLDGESRYIVTTETGHVWHDAHGSRCSDLGRVEGLPPLPDDDASESDWEEWSSSVCVLAAAQGVRIE